MNNIKAQIQEFHKNTPRKLLWLLMGVAFILVIVLIFLLVKSKNKENVNFNDIEKDVVVNISPNPVICKDIEIGKSCDSSVRITASGDTTVQKVEIPTTIDDMTVISYCDETKINNVASCHIRMIFMPSNELNDVIKINIPVIYGDTDFQQTAYIKVELSTKPVEKVVREIEKIAGPATIPEPEIIYDEPEYDIYDDEIEEPVISEPKKSISTRKKTKRAEKCSDFAMPGYDSLGNQIGWIKPNNGRYEYHPYDDIECKNPTGLYNPMTGIIVDINDSSRKIGTDAEHIGYKSANYASLPASFDIDRPSTKIEVAPASGNSTAKGGMKNLLGTFEFENGTADFKFTKDDKAEVKLKGSGDAESVYSSMPYDRTFILRQFKPIPATIVSEVRADPSIYGEEGSKGVPIRATVDRNVYSDNGRTVILPTGTLLMGYLTGKLPGPYSSVGRMQINWYQFIRPDGVEFNFEKEEQDPYSADAQGRVGVPGYGSTDYVEQIVMPLLTAMVPAAVNMIAPIADTFVNQIDLDNNTVVQSGKVRSSELAKNEVITAWNQVAQKLIVDALDNTVPPFSIAAGTRITVYSPVDLIATCGSAEDNPGKKCAFAEYGSKSRRTWSKLDKPEIDKTDPSWIGQVRSFNIQSCCNFEAQDKVDKTQLDQEPCSNYDYRTLALYCQSQQYVAINNAKQDALYQNQISNFKQYDTSASNDGVGGFTVSGNQAYNEQILGLEYTDDGVLKNPFEKTTAEEYNGILCDDGSKPNSNGCCTGETLTDMGGGEMACCPDSGGDCFPPFDI